MKITSHIDIAPAKDKRACGNCKCFHLWGVSMGVCCLNWKDKLNTQWCKNFDKKEAEK